MKGSTVERMEIHENDPMSVRHLQRVPAEILGKYSFLKEWETEED